MFLAQCRRYLSEYFAVASFSGWRFFLTLISALAYKTLAIVRPFVAAMIIAALTELNVEKTYSLILLYTIVYLFYRLAYFINYRSFSLTVAYVYRSMQTKIFQKLITVDNNFTRQIPKGFLLNTINSDLIEIGEMCDEISEFFTTFLQVIAILVIVGFYHWGAMLWLLVSMICYGLTRDWSDSRYNFYWAKTRTENDRYSTLLSQVMSGLSEVKTFNLLPKMQKRLSRIQSRYDKYYQTQRKFYAIFMADSQLIYALFQTGFYLLLVWLLLEGLIGVEVIVLLVSYHEQLLNYLDKITNSAATIRLTNASVRHVQTILDYQSSKQEEFGELNLDDLSGTLTFRNVSLELERKPILKKLNFEIKSHEFVAITGHPGAGKTKLFDLILRIYKPTHGKILLDNININAFSREVYTTNVAVANQSPFIFNMSIRKNLDLVDTDIERQIEACKRAGIHDFIESLPQGYNTILHENATNISGGQKQMISIARTILTDAEVLLLDDVTTALDPDTAKLLPKLIKNLRGERTIIMITKKPELMRLADQIIVLDRGAIVATGTHEKLLKRSSVYQSLQNNPSESQPSKRSANFKRALGRAGNMGALHD